MERRKRALVHRTKFPYRYAAATEKISTRAHWLIQVAFLFNFDLLLNRNKLNPNNYFSSHRMLCDVAAASVFFFGFQEKFQNQISWNPSQKNLGSKFKFRGSHVIKSWVPNLQKNLEPWNPEKKTYKS